MIVTKQQFKLIITDHDGTLVNDERKLLPQTRETLERLHAQGYLFGLASGRTVADAKTFPSKWGLSFDRKAVETIRRERDRGTAGSF